MAALRRAVAAARAAGESGIQVEPGAELKVSVAIDSGHLVPYHVAWDGRTIIDSVRPASARLTVAAGEHTLGWGFLHKFETGWHHTVTVSIDSGAGQVVDSKSSAGGDDPNSAGTVIVHA